MLMACVPYEVLQIVFKVAIVTLHLVIEESRCHQAKQLIG